MPEIPLWFDFAVGIISIAAAVTPYLLTKTSSISSRPSRQIDEVSILSKAIESAANKIECIVLLEQYDSILYRIYSKSDYAGRGRKLLLLVLSAQICVWMVMTYVFLEIDTWTSIFLFIEAIVMIIVGCFLMVRHLKEGGEREKEYGIYIKKIKQESLSRFDNRNELEEIS